MIELTDQEREKVAARVRAALAPQERRPGELRADVVADAIVLDVQETHAPVDLLATIADDVLVQAARDLRRDFGEPIASFALPFGSPVVAGPPGSVVIAGHTLVLGRHAPGLHPIETTRRDAHGQNLESLRHMIRLRSSPSLLQRMGLPSPTFVGDGGVVRHLLDFPPLAEAADAVLRHDLDDMQASRFCTAPLRQMERFAATIVRNAQWLCRRRVRTARRVEAVRRAAVAGIAQAYPGHGPTMTVERICVDARSIGLHDDPTLIVEYDGFDEALRRGRLIDVVRGDENPERGKLLKAPLAHARHFLEGGRLESLLADGSIDAQAAAVVGAAPEGASAVLLRLARDLETCVSLRTPNGPFHAALFWREGVIRTEALGDGLTLWRDEISPASAATEPDQTNSIGIEEGRGGDPDTWLVNTSAGVMWPAHASPPAYRFV